MSKQHGFRTRTKGIYTNLRPYLPSPPVLAAGALLILGAGLVFALPDHDDAASIADSSASAPIVPDETLCDRQAWPYMDQRCAARVDAARGSRQVRIVTDKGNSVRTVTPLPIVEKKPAPQPKPQPTVAQASPQIGPPVAPHVEGQPSEPTTTEVPPHGSKAMASANVSPVSASTTPPAPGADALDDARPKSKSARAAERAEKREAEKAKKREAKRRKIEQDDDGAQDVTDATRSSIDARGDRSRSRRARADVPDDVIDAVEAATARDHGRTVSVESPRGRRVYVVPRDGGW